MEKVNDKKTFQILLGGRIRERLDKMTEYYEKTRADVIRDAINYLYSESYMKNAFGYGKGTETGTAKPKRTNAHERRAALEALDDPTLTQVLKPLLDREFRKSDKDEIYVTTPPIGARMIHVKIVNQWGGEDADCLLSYYLNQWQKTKDLDKLIIN